MYMAIFNSFLYVYQRVYVDHLQTGRAMVDGGT